MNLNLTTVSLSRIPFFAVNPPNMSFQILGVLYRQATDFTFVITWIGMRGDMRSNLSTRHATDWTYLQSFLSFLRFLLNFHFSKTMDSILVAIDGLTIRIRILANIAFIRILFRFSVGNVCHFLDVNFFHVIGHRFQCFQMESAYVTSEWKIGIVGQFVLDAGRTQFTEFSRMCRRFSFATCETFNRCGYCAIEAKIFVVIVLFIVCGFLKIYCIISLCPSIICNLFHTSRSSASNWSVVDGSFFTFICSKYFIDSKHFSRKEKLVNNWFIHVLHIHLG